ncbi:hypothetical protein GC194_08225 [bacterium]|nr:hypothetical protein [bacterium]
MAKASAQIVTANVVTIHDSEENADRDLLEFATIDEYHNWKTAKLTEWWNEGYLGARVLAETIDSNTIDLNLWRGKAIEINKINLHHIKSEWQRALRRDFSISGVVPTSGNYADLLNEALIYFENSGYPFARVWLDSFKTSANGMEASLFVDEGLLFTFYSLAYEDDIKINNNFLLNYLDIRKGEVFNYKKISSIEEKIAGLPNLSLRQAPGVSFSDEGKVRVWLDLQNEQVSSFDGIIGLAPKAAAGNKTLVTGQFDFKLRNPFARGTSFDLAFEKFQQSSQKLNTNFEYPFLLSTPLGVQFQFDLLKYDTTYINLNTRISLAYFFSGNSRVKFFYHKTRAYPLNSLPSVLSQYSNIGTQLYGLGLDKSQLDYLPNPARGYTINAEASVGKKNKYLPDNQTEVSTVANVTATLSSYLPVLPKLVLFAKNMSVINVDSTFSQSQVKWIGGLKTIRGYNEGSIPSKNSVIQTVELRYLTDRNSHIKLFGDAAMVTQFNAHNKLERKVYYGFGLGYNFKTGPGIFSIGYAIAANKNTAISLTNGKVHFGFLSYF